MTALEIIEAARDDLHRLIEGAAEQDPELWGDLFEKALPTIHDALVVAIGKLAAREEKPSE